MHRLCGSIVGRDNKRTTQPHRIGSLLMLLLPCMTRRGVKWSGVELLMADGRWLIIHIIISPSFFFDLAWREEDVLIFHHVSSEWNIRLTFFR